MITKPIAASIRHFSRLPTLVCGLLLSLPAKAEEWVDAAEFGLGKLPPGADATPVLRAAMEACIKEKASGLKVPAGDWHLFPQFAFEQNLAVANNDPGIRRVVFPIDLRFNQANLEEDLSGTDPQDSSSRSQLRVVWASQPGMAYYVETSDSLHPGALTPLHDDPLVARTAESFWDAMRSGNQRIHRARAFLPNPLIEVSP